MSKENPPLPCIEPPISNPLAHTLSLTEAMKNQADERASDLRWLEQRGDTLQMIMKENVDIAGSQAQLSIPLLDWPLSTSLPLSLSATYSSSSETPKNGLLGSGWSFNHPQDFIIVDHKGGVFPTTFDYILVVNSQLEKLTPIFNSTVIPGIYKFRLANEDENSAKIQIIYDQTNERWTIESKNLRAVFGRSPNPALVPDAVQETLHWDNWRGFGYSEENLDSLQKVAQAWYLIYREEKHGFKTKLLYEYKMEEEQLPNGKTYTSLVQLSSVRTETINTENSMRLDFHYGTKERNEYHVQSPKNSHGHYRFPLFLQSKLFLEGFTLTTGKNLRQQLGMEYETKGNVRLLKGINQIYNEGFSELLIRFIYNEYKEGVGKRYLISETRLGFGEQNAVKYFYKELQIPMLDFGPEVNTREYLTTKNMQLKIGEKYSVIADLTGRTVVTLKILDRELSASLTSLEVHIKVDDEIEGEKIDEYALILYPNLLGLFVTSTNENVDKDTGRQFLALFHCKDGKWPETPIFFGVFSKKDLFRYSDKIMLFARETGLFEIFEVDDDSENGFESHSVSANSHLIRRCVIQDSIILAFDGHFLFTITKSLADENWVKNSNFAAATSSEIEFTDKVSMDEFMVSIINQQITKFGLQMYKNMVLLSDLVWENDFFSCKANLYLLDDSYKLHKSATFVSGGESANKSILDFEKVEENDGTVLTFKYKLVDSKYKFQLVEMSGKIREDMLKACEEGNGGKCPEAGLELIEKEIEKLIKNTNAEQDHIFRDVMLFDPSPCLSYQLDGSGVVTNSSIIHMQGSSWAQEWVEKPSNVSSIALQSTFILESTQHKNQTDFQLFAQNPEDGGKEGDPLKMFSLGLNGTMAIGFPSYIAYQISELYPIVIIPMVGNNTGPKIEKKGQQLLGMSTAETLLTYQILDDPLLYPKDTKVFATRVSSLIASQPFNVLERSEVSSENGEVVRFTKYENEFVSNRTSLQQENTVRIIPNLSPNYSGSYEEVTIIPLETPANATKTQRWVDTEGVVVRSKVLDFSEAINATKPADEFHTLYDLSGNLKIADIFPYNLTQEMVAYYGFEKYENASVFGTNLKFENENVVFENGDSLTGRNVLRLEEGHNLTLNLCPSDQSHSYTASCWVRTMKSDGVANFVYDSPVPYFKANLGFKSDNDSEIITPFLTVYGQMKRYIDNWLYLEVTTDLDKIRSNVYTEFYKQNEKDETMIGLSSPVSTRFTISIEISTNDEFSVDVDHIKFVPTGSDISIKVFGGMKEAETIFENGEIARKIYQEVSGEEVAEIEEDSQVGLFRSGTKSGSLFPGGSNSTLGTGMKSELVLKPESGSFERFNLFQFQIGRWTTTNPSKWEMNGTGKIAHLGVNEVTELRVGKPEIMFGNGFSSSALSFQFRFSSDINIETLQVLLGNGRHKLLEIKSDSSSSSCNLAINGSSTLTQRVPCHGQIVLLIENQTMWLWFDGLLLHEGATGLDNPWSNLVLTARGELTLSNMLILNKPQVMQTFFNAFGQRTQMLKLESENEVRITELIYDEMGRESIRTKTGKLSRQGSQPILKYYPELVSNRSPYHHNYVLRTGKVEGLLTEMYPEDEGYSYGRTFYMNDLTGEVAMKGYPGKDFLKGGKFIKEYGRDSNILFLHQLFPPSEGFTQRVIKEPNSNILVKIFDSKGREVGDYTQVPGYSHILTTYEYDEEGNLLKILPPNYHRQVDTFSRESPLATSEKSGVELYWAEKLGTYFTYNEANQMTSKTTPDIDGRQEYLYDMLGNLRFFYSAETKVGIETARDIIYLLHSDGNKPVEVGYIKGELPVKDLYAFQNSTEVPNIEKQVYQRIIYSDSHSDPNIRGRVKLFMTYNGGELEEFTSDNGPPHQELLRFDSHRNLVLKTTNTATSRAEQSEVLTSMHKHYKAGKMTELQYPREAEVSNATSTPFSLLISHDRSGHLTALGTREEPKKFASFSYSGSGSILSETIEPGSEFEFTRNFEYNAPGLLTRISDKFLSQNISFTESGYGQIGYGDGIVMSTQFDATWAKTATMYNPTLYRQWFSVPTKDYDDQQIMSMCLKALTRLGFLDKYFSVPQKFLGHDKLSLLPLACGGSTGHKLMQLLGSKLPPIREYGHTYSYGNYKELRKAKFFTENDDNIPTPFQINSFHEELPSLVQNVEVSESIWEALKNVGFIIVDNPTPEYKSGAIGKEGNEPIFKYNELQSNLEAVDFLAVTYTKPIIHLLFDIISENGQMIILSEFQDTYINWLGYNDDPLVPIVVINKAKQDAQKIYEMLNQQGYTSGNIESILNEEFLKAMAPFTSYIAEITSVLRKHFISQLRLSINDYDSVTVDPNGNHKVFYVGLNRHVLEYSENTNKITKLTVQDPFAPIGEDLTVFELEHSPQGNVVKAQHRNIDTIRYHPVTNRPVYISLSDGRRLIFQYDSQGERILKRVYDSNEIILSEVTYLRDETGRVIRDIRTTFGENPVSITTTYIHGPRGLLGFIRGSKFFSVFTDHAGSIRLVTQGGKVQAGYDYWPYGAPMREFGEVDTHINYRFTGQEYDEETGLYTFHARLYDPLLGRFYQPDPKSQYASPYIYAGNSPLSMVDPDGEFADIIAIMILAIIGAYLAAAAVNNSWDFTKWDWTDFKTYLALVGGAVAGAGMPGSFAALAGAGGIGAGAAVAVGLVGSFVSAGLEFGWNPLSWDWTSPSLYNSFFGGFGTALKADPSTIAFILSLQELGGLLKTGQLNLLLKKLINGLGNAYLEGLAANGNILNLLEWDWTSGETWEAIKNGFIDGSNAPLGYLEYLENFVEVIEGIRADSQIGGGNTVARIGMQNRDILRDKSHPLFHSLGESLVGQLKEYGGRGETKHIMKWDKMVMSTFEGVLNSMMEPPGLLKMVNEFRTAGLKLPQEKLFERLTTQSGMVRKAVHRFNRGIMQLSNFYFETSVPDPEYESAVKILISGLHAGRNVQVDSGFLENFVDCEAPKTYEGIDNVEQCDIGSGSGRKMLQNREMIHEFFHPTKKYENKTGFLHVENPSRISDEFLDDLVFILNKIPGNTAPKFLYEFFIGAVYYSLLSQNHDIFIRKEIISPNFKVLHLALLKNEKLFVRTVAIGSRENFEDSEFLLDYLKNQNFKCQVQSAADRYKIKLVRGELNFIQIGENLQLFTHTPKLANACKEGSSSEFFKKIPRVAPPGGENIFEDFEVFNLGQERFELSEKFMESAKSIFRGKNALLGNQTAMSMFRGEKVHLGKMENLEGGHSFTGFLLGFIVANLRHTFDVQFVIQSHSKLVFVSRDNGYGVDNWEATPVIINLNSGSGPFDYDSDHQLYPLSSFTLADEAIGADVDELSEFIAYSNVALPTFSGFWGQNEHLEENIRQSLKYLYYSMSNYETQDESDEKAVKNKHFASSSILGEFLGGNESLQSFVFTGTPENDKKRLKAQRILLVVEENSGNATIFNFIESTKIAENGEGFEFNPNVETDIPSLPFGVEISNLTEFKISLNVNSKVCWKYEEQFVATNSATSCFFQGLESRVVGNLSDIPRESSYFKLERDATTPNAFLSFGQNHIKNLFNKLAAPELKPFVKSDIDLSSIVSAYLFKMERKQVLDKDGLQLRVRQRVSPSIFPVEHSLLSVTESGEVVPGSEEVLLQNIVPKSGTVPESLQEAEVELREYYCSQPERFSEFLRVTDVPAVFGPRLRFEIEPDTLYRPDCNSNSSKIAPEKVSNFYKRNLDPIPPATSSASSPFSRIENVLKYLKSSFSNFWFGRKQPSIESNPYGNPQTCQQGAWLDGSYNLDGLTCYNSASKISIFPSVEPYDLISHKNWDFPPPLLPLIGDAYSKSSCEAIEFNGVGSVTCKGQKSTFIYTPYHQERLFDNVDGNIMLGRVIFYLGAKLVGQGNPENLGEIPENISDISQEQINKWRRILNKIKMMVVGNNLEDNLEWATPLVEDCKEMLDEIEKEFNRVKAGKNSTKLGAELGHIFEERLYSLYDDVEEILVQPTSENFDVPEPKFEFETGHGIGSNLNEFIAQNVVLPNRNGYYDRNTGMI